MDALEEYLSSSKTQPAAPAPVRAAGFPVVTPEVQRGRDSYRQKILGQELAQNQAALASATTPEARQLAQSNIDSLNREMSGKSFAPVGKPSAAAAALPAPITAPSGAPQDELEQYLSGTTAKVPAPTVAPTTPEKQKSNVAAVAERNLPARYEVPVALASGALAAPIAGLAGIVGSLLPGEAGQGARWVKNVQDAMIYQPTSEGGKKVMEGVGTVLENLIEKPTEAIGSGVAELYGPAAGAVTKGALQAAPGLLGLRGGKPPAISGVVREMAPAAEVVATDIPTIVRRQAEARRAAEAGAQPMAAAPEAAPVAPAIAGRQTYQELQNTLNAQRAAAQSAPAITAESKPGVLGTAKPTNPEAPFTEIKYAENGLPLDEQSARAQTLNRVLGSDYYADLAAIEGKGKERATNYATSNTDTATGNFLKEKFADEQKRLADFAERQVKNTGGTVGLDESTVYKRGNTILKPLQDLETNFDNATRKIYAERDALAKDIPVEAQNIMKVLNDESLTLANTETIGLTNIAKARMKQLGMIDKDGNLLPTDAKTAENFRKFVNENWDRKNANLHRQLKEAVDTDVLANLDTNTPFYKDARALVELRKNTLDNPNGISKILDADGPKGINRKVQIEKIAQNIADMPVDQFTHVIDTLKGVPPELQPQATAALSEIKAQFANRVAEQKTPRQVTKYMNDNREVMNRVFTPDEMANLRDYHNAVHILATDTGYKGAAVQKINVEQKLGSKIKEHLITKAAAVAAETATGGAGMGAPALITHELLSQRAATKRVKAQAKAEQQAFEKTQRRFVQIQDLIK